MTQEFNTTDVENYSKYMKINEHAYKYCGTPTAEFYILLINKISGISANEITILLDFLNFIINEAKIEHDLVIYCMHERSAWPIYVRLSDTFKSLGINKVEEFIN